MATKKQVRQKIEELWRRVCILGPRQCWPWMGQGSATMLWHDGFEHAVTRLVWSVTSGLPLSMCPTTVKQTCGNCACCNPRHFPSTSRQNLTDRKLAEIETVTREVGPRLRREVTR